MINTIKNICEFVSENTKEVFIHPENIEMSVNYFYSRKLQMKMTDYLDDNSLQIDLINKNIEDFDKEKTEVKLLRFNNINDIKWSCEGSFDVAEIPISHDNKPICIMPTKIMVKPDYDSIMGIARVEIDKASIRFLCYYRRPIDFDIECAILKYKPYKDDEKDGNV